VKDAEAPGFPRGMRVHPFVRHQTIRVKIDESEQRRAGPLAAGRWFLSWFLGGLSAPAGLHGPPANMRGATT
jgi:hypothetical protein